MGRQRDLDGGQRRALDTAEAIASDLYYDCGLSDVRPRTTFHGVAVDVLPSWIRPGAFLRSGSRKLGPLGLRLCHQP